MKYLRKVAGVRVYELEVPSTSWGDKQYGHRRPYLYLPRHDLFLWGSPGSVHFDLAEEAKNLLMGVNPRKYMDYDFDRSEAVYGSYFTGNDGQATNSIWYIEEWVDKPEVLDRLQQVTGVPVNQNVNAEAYIDEIDELDWALPPTTGSSFVDAEPVDKWWEGGCPNCENPDLDVKFHGGIECSKCGWEGDMTKGGELLGMSPPTEEYADSVWPDALPWDEAEQNYYRNAKIAAWLPKTGGTRLAGFYVWTADIAEKARMVRRQLIVRPDVIEWMTEQDEKRNEENTDKTLPVTPMIELVRGFMNQIPDEGFKLFPWWMREIKKGLFDKQQWGHALDIAKQAAQWAEWSREHNKPMPDYMKKDFVFDDMQKWVYELNAKNVTDEAGWTDSTTVYKFEDGWHVDRVGADDLGREGELMGHCVGGYCNEVRTERSTIYSFRDPKGMPHVTLEVSGPPLATGKGEAPKGDFVPVVQVQGKQDTEPIPEYRAKVDEWYDHLKNEIGYSWVEEEDPDREPEVEYVDHPEGPFVLESIDDMFLYVGILQDPYEREYNFGQDEDPEYEGNHVYYANPRDFEVSKSLMELAVQFVKEIDKYDEDEIVEYVRGMWLAMNHLGQNRRYNPGFAHNPAGEWGEFAQQFKQFADTNLVITPKDSPRGQDRMFSVDPYRVDKLPLKVEHMLDYIFQIAGMDQEKYVTKHTRPVFPEGWNDQLREKREAMEEWKDFFKWEQAMKAGFPQEDYTITRNYEFPGVGGGGYITQWDQIFNMDEWQWKPQLQAQSSWRLGVNEEGIASRALGLLHVNHGFSLDPLGNPVEPGYYVSYEGFERTIPLSAITDLDISNYMHDHANILSRTPDSFFGGWIDDNDNVILDVSRSFQILEEAQEFGRANHQDFLYDGFNAASIAVEYEAEMTHTGSVWLPKTTP